MGTMGDLLFFMTGKLTTESRSAMSNGAARLPRPPFLPSNNETDENITLPLSSSRHHRVVSAPGLRREQGRGGMLGIELSLSLRGRMTLGVGAIFWFISHTMPYQPEGLVLHIYSWPRQPAYAKMLV
jgi:hypothetical protein